MKIIVTGALGLVGKAVTSHCRSIGDDVVALSHQNLDITDENAVNAMVSKEKPEAIINCAAYTDVDGAESNQELSFAVNDTAVGYLASAASESHAAFITISTDYVFDGKKSGFYDEEDRAKPLSVYGRTKLSGEKTAFAANKNSIVVRTGWIYGIGGTNFLCVMDSLLKAGKTINAISDSFGTPTFAGDLAVRLRELADVEAAGVVHVTNDGEGASYFEFAARIAEHGGLDSELINDVAASSLKRAAPRPVNSRLGCRAASLLGLGKLPHWEDGIRQFLKEKAESQ